MGGCSASHEDELPYMQLQDSLSRQKKTYNMDKPKLQDHVSTMTIIEYILTLNEADLQRGWNSIDKKADKLALNHGFDKLLTHFILKYMNETFPHVAPSLDDNKRLLIIDEITKMLESTSIGDGFVSQQWFTKLKCSDNDIASTLQEIAASNLKDYDAASSPFRPRLKFKNQHSLPVPPRSGYSDGIRMFSLDEEMSLDDTDTPSASTPPPSVLAVQSPPSMDHEEKEHELDLDALMDHESELLVDDILSEEKERQNMISGYIVQDIPAPAIVLNEPRVYFDRLREDAVRDKVLLVQSSGLTSGCHEFVIQILKSDIDLIEIGVIGTADIDAIDIAEGGVWTMDELGSRAVYGNELCTAKKYYGSVNGDGSERSYIDLTDRYKRGWCTNDRIRVSLDLDQWTAQFFVNGKKVKNGGQVHLEPDQSYHPVICFGKSCRYLLHNPPHEH